MPGSAVGRVVATAPWAALRDAVVVEMRSWTSGTRAAVSGVERADVRSANDLPIP